MFKTVSVCVCPLSAALFTMAVIAFGSIMCPWGWGSWYGD